VRAGSVEAVDAAIGLEDGLGDRQRRRYLAEVLLDLLEGDGRFVDDGHAPETFVMSEDSGVACVVL
jgi:hypothetical protein